MHTPRGKVKMSHRKSIVKVQIGEHGTSSPNDNFFAIEKLAVEFTRIRENECRNQQVGSSIPKV